MHAASRRAAVASRCSQRVQARQHHCRLNAFVCDVTDAKAVSSTFANIRANLGEPDALPYNVGGGHFAPYDAISGDDLELDFQSNALGLLLASQQVSSRMAARGRGVIGITGATSSWRSTASSPREALPSRWHASWVQREFTSFTPFCLTIRPRAARCSRRAGGSRHTRHRAQTRRCSRDIAETYGTWRCSRAPRGLLS